MSFDRYWERLKLSNSALSDDDAKVTLRIAELKRLLSKAFAAGYDERRELQVQLDRIRNKAGGSEIDELLRKFTGLG